jgi:hypothetical protein
VQKYCSSFFLVNIREHSLIFPIVRVGPQIAESPATSTLNRLAQSSEIQIRLEEQKAAAFDRIASTLMLDHLSDDARSAFLTGETELMQLQQRKRKLQLELELKKLENDLTKE